MVKVANVQRTILEKRNRKVKISKSRLKQIIKEEIQSDTALIKAIGALADKIEILDVSLDFLSAAIIGGDPVSIGAGQKTMGRAYRPSANLAARLNEENYDSASCEELQGMLNTLNKDLESKVDKEATETQNEIDVIKNLIKIKKCVGN